MITDLKNEYPRELREQVDLTIGELVENKILKPNSHSYKLTATGEEIVYENDYYTIDRLINKILVHLRDNNLFKNARWPHLTAIAFCDSLDVFEQRLFDKAMKQMTGNGYFDYDDFHNAYIITEKCQNKMYGLG